MYVRTTPQLPLHRYSLTLFLFIYFNISDNIFNYCSLSHVPIIDISY